MSAVHAHLALGSNMGDRWQHLEDALALLAKHAAIDVLRVSSPYETEALLPVDLPAERHADWDRPYVNVVAVIATTLRPAELLSATQAVEQRLGRQRGERWAPRAIDVDIVTYGEVRLDTDDLVIPHPRATDRAFVLAPLSELDPALRLPGSRASVLDLLRGLGEPLPAWMQITNITPDSFSGDGLLGPGGDPGRVPETACNYLDFGAESTRPGAAAIDPGEEWRRLRPALARIPWERRVRPRVSVDTRHAATASRALAAGADTINDVSGLRDPAMVEVVADAGCDVVVMHSLSVPADPAQVVAAELDVVAEVRGFFEQRLEALDRVGVAPGRVILDPGVGFGKTAAQSWDLLRAVAGFTTLGCRLLVGHSRKSFLAAMTDAPAAGRDAETLGVSLALASAGVDIVRVHDATLHRRAWRAYARARA